MKYSIIISAIALQEEAEAFLYYESEAEGLGENFLQDIEMALERISEHPTHYSYSDSTKTIRDIGLTTFPFVIIFRIVEDKIIVFNIHHTKKSTQ